jgi:hypothetical protein
MSTPNPYFLFPFASSGTATGIDNTGGSTGPVNYEFGFTPNYEEDLTTVPSALPIPRPQFNQLMLDITFALQQLQLQGAPLWVAPATGSPPVGGPASYPLYARVSYNPGVPYGLQVWESQITSNTSVPGADNNWVIVSGARGLAPGTYIDSASPNGYVGALLCDGSAYVRTTYPLLFQALTFTASCTTNGTNVVTVPSNVLALVTPYLQGTIQPCYVESSNIAVGTYITAISSSTITLTNAASSSGTFTLTFLPYGYGTSGSATTFGVPNCLRTVNVAAGGSGNTVLSAKLAAKGGFDTYTMQLTDLFNHTHSFSALVRSSQNGTVGGTLNPFLVTPSNFLFTTNFINGRSDSGLPNPNQDQTAMNIMQQSTVVFRYVKY